MFKTFTRGLSAVVLAFGFGGAAQAALLSTAGTWSAVTPNNATDLSGVGTNEIRWGFAFGGPQSGYRFAGVSNQAVTLPDTLGGTVLVEMGTFTHFNLPIAFDNNFITSATLDIDLSLVNGGSIDTTLSFVFDHLETHNFITPCAAGGRPPCPDLVQIAGNSPTQSFMADGMNYQFDIFGFRDTNGVTNPSFLTAEGVENKAALIGRITKISLPTSLPEPATAALFGFGLAGLVFAARRRHSHRL